MVVTRSFYTVEQLAEFMDVELDPDAEIFVNNRMEELQSLVYENFSVDWKVLSFRSTAEDVYPKANIQDLPKPVLNKGETEETGAPEAQKEQAGARLPDKAAPTGENETAIKADKEVPKEPTQTTGSETLGQAEAKRTENVPLAKEASVASPETEPLPEAAKEATVAEAEKQALEKPATKAGEEATAQPEKTGPQAGEAQKKEAAAPAGDAGSPSERKEETDGFVVTVNGEPITLKKKKKYVFVDIFDYINFNLLEARGRMIMTEVNGQNAQYTQVLHPGDDIKVYWKEL